MDDDDDDMSGNVSLGDMIRRQTSGLKKGIQKHEDALAAHSAELHRCAGRDPGAMRHRRAGAAGQGRES